MLGWGLTGDELRALFAWTFFFFRRGLRGGEALDWELLFGDGLRARFVCSMVVLVGGGIFIFIGGLEHLPNRHLIRISLVAVKIVALNFGVRCVECFTRGHLMSVFGVSWTWIPSELGATVGR